MSEASLLSRQALDASPDENPPPRPYRLTFLPQARHIEVNPAAAALAGHHEGEPGSILDLAERHGVHIEHACGGFAACSTCHVIVRQGLASCNESGEEEEDMLDEAPGLTPQSRLACQCIPDGSCDVVVEIPSWNRNLVSESHGSSSGS